MSTPLTLAVQELAEARRNAEVTKSNYDARLAAWKDEHQPLRELVDAAAEELRKADGKVRVMTIAAFRATGEKRPAVGVSIRVGQRASYPEDEALAWARQTGIALKVDERALERVLFALPPEQRPAWFRVEEQITATIATKLDEVLS